MNNYQIFHRSKKYQKMNRLILANKKRMIEMQPDLVIDFAQCPRLFFATKFADVLSLMKPAGVERIKNPFQPHLDDDCAIDIGTEDELEWIDDVDYVHFHVFNRYDILDHEKTTWNSEIPCIGAVETPVLDEEKINTIALPERLLFKLDQDPSFLFMHNSVVDKMLENNMQDIWVRWGEE